MTAPSVAANLALSCRPAVPAAAQQGRDPRPATRRCPSAAAAAAAPPKVCRGLAALEGVRPPVLHRDVKPSNVFIDASGAARLGDFGLARPLPPNRACLTGETGTYLYMSPEMIRRGWGTSWPPFPAAAPPRRRVERGAAALASRAPCRAARALAPRRRHEVYDGKSDVWSFGVLLSELITGQVPYQHTFMTPVQVRRRGRAGRGRAAPRRTLQEAGTGRLAARATPLDPTRLPAAPQIAMAVADEKLAPLLPADGGLPAGLLAAASLCCDFDPEMRPSFATLVPELEDAVAELKARCGCARCRACRCSDARRRARAPCRRHDRRRPRRRPAACWAASSPATP